jgi:integrase
MSNGSTSVSLPRFDPVHLWVRLIPKSSGRWFVVRGGGLRVSEAVALTWSDVLPRDDRVQLSITGKGGKVRQVVLPDVVSRSLLTLVATPAPTILFLCKRLQSALSTSDRTPAAILRPVWACTLKGCRIKPRREPPIRALAPMP